MKISLALAGMVALAAAMPNIGSFPFGPRDAPAGCDDCKDRYDACVKFAGVKDVNGGGCEKICAKRACQMNPICKDCNNDFLNCTGLNKYPAPTIVVEETEEEQHMDERRARTVNIFEMEYDLVDRAVSDPPEDDCAPYRLKCIDGLEQFCTDKCQFCVKKNCRDLNNHEVPCYC